MKKISFKLFTITGFAFLSFLVVGIVLYVNHNFDQKVIKETANSQFEIMTSSFTKKIQNFDKTYRNSIDIFTISLQDLSMEYILENREKMLKKFTNFLEIKKNISSIYITTKDNQSFTVRRSNEDLGIDADPFVTKKYKWIIREISQNIENRSYYDKNLQMVKNVKLQNSFDYTKRIWYKDAVKYAHKTIRTRPYKYDIYDRLGITYAKEYKKGFVIGVDLPLKKSMGLLKNSLQPNIKNTYIITGEENIIVGLCDSCISITEKIYKNSKTFPNDITINIDNVDYIYSIDLVGDDYLVSYTNFDDIVLPYSKELRKNIAITICIIFMISLIIWYLTSYVVVEPIRSLLEDSRKVANRNFNGVRKVESRILELSDLSDSIIKMSEDVQHYQARLEKISTTDSLTGLNNRTMLDSTLNTNIDEFIRYGYIFGLMMIDIDHFKYVNDEYGHQMGDKVLVEFSKLLKKNIRSVDVIGRWGGEEFLIICKETNMENLFELAQKLRQKIQNHEFETIGHKTASFGVTICYEGDNKDRIIGRADAALYKAKNSGRNMVIAG